MMCNVMRVEINSVLVPESWPPAEEIEAKQAELENPRKATTWKEVHDKIEMLRYVLARNKIHFHQAAGTSTTEEFLRQMFDWAASSIGAEEILSGEYNGLDLNTTERTVLKYMKRQTKEIIPATITKEDVAGKLCVWRENTSTSPFGQHFGRYKTLVAPLNHLHEDQIEECMKKQEQLLIAITAVI